MRVATDFLRQCMSQWQGLQQTLSHDVIVQLKEM